MAIEELDYDHNVFQDQFNAEHDKNLAVRFFTAAIPNPHKSAEAGRPIFEDTVMVEIRVRGDRNNIVHKPADDLVKHRFSRAWEAFNKRQQVIDDGTPLAQWPQATPSMVEELKYLGFHTVEQLSQASDGVCAKMAGLQSMKQKALVFLEQAKGLAPATRLLEENAELKSQLESQARMLAEMNAKLNALANGQQAKKAA